MIKYKNVISCETHLIKFDFLDGYPGICVWPTYSGSEIEIEKE